jgi:hypothetical protein
MTSFDPLAPDYGCDLARHFPAPKSAEELITLLAEGGGKPPGELALELARDAWPQHDIASARIVGNTLEAQLAVPINVITITASWTPSTTPAMPATETPADADRPDAP